MSLRLYNTLTKTKDPFVPLDPKNVRMYVCGPTVYDYAHIGNARPAIVFDVLFRLLRHTYGEKHVTYVRNITDIDDKINARAAERVKGGSVPILDMVREITEETTRIYNEDMAALGNLPPTRTPRATANIEPMIAMIKKLIADDHAYPKEGHVLFRVESKSDYGKLSRRSLDEMVAGARIEVAPYKENAMDFVLWKPSDDKTPGWPSPWGRGRPGWHIECSAMIEKEFPDTQTIDIHGGGIDLVFPHHENEIAQSEGAHHNHPLAKVWMHNGHLQVEGDKMSKSLGNFVTIREILHEFVGDVPRLQMLSTHYRSPVDWTWSGATEARSELLEWADLVAGHNLTSSVADKELDQEFRDALADDLNTSLALTRLRELFREARKSSAAALLFLKGVRLLGFQQLHKPGYFTGSVVSPSSNMSDEKRQMRTQFTRSFQMSTANGLSQDAEEFQSKLDSMGFVATLKTEGSAFVDQKDKPESGLESRIREHVRARETARKAKDFKESDRIRDELAAQGIVLKDNPDGTTTWEVKR